MFTIAQFAERTGLSSSALRFYERKGLLAPATRLENGYRVYAPEQVAEAQLISSLREAAVGIAELRAFLQAETSKRHEMLATWKAEAAARLLRVQMAAQYLRSLQPDEPQIHLHRWEEASLLVWLPAEVEATPLPYGPAITKGAKRLREAGVKILSGGYVRTLDMKLGRLVGQVGFRVKVVSEKTPSATERTEPPHRLLRRSERLPDDATVEPVSPCMFATLECTTDDERAAHRIFRFLDGFGIVPAGLHLERYLPGETDRYQLMIAVTRPGEG